ncbi:hypothetical protein BDW69DRAFT_33541 [Aspergillus filifer]
MYSFGKKSDVIARQIMIISCVAFSYICRFRYLRSRVPPQSGSPLLRHSPTSDFPFPLPTTPDLYSISDRNSICRGSLIPVLHDGLSSLTPARCKPASLGPAARASLFCPSRRSKHLADKHDIFVGVTCIFVAFTSIKVFIALTGFILRY